MAYRLSTGIRLSRVTLIGQKILKRQILSVICCCPRAFAQGLDLGNHAKGGLFVLGQPWNGENKHSGARLRSVAELFQPMHDAGARHLS